MTASPEVEAPALPRRSAGYFAQRVVYAWELPSIMRKHIYTGAMGNVWASLISGIFFIHFGNAMGMSRFEWGLMGGISSWLLTFQLLSAWLTHRVGRRKPIWFWFAVVDRSLRLVGILAALVLWQEGLAGASVALVSAVCMANFFGAMSSPPWISWLADIIPEERHGAFWGRRSMWIALSIILTVLPAGLLIDRITAEHKVAAMMWVFLAATVIGLLDLVIHGTIPEPAMAMPENGPFLRQIVLPLRDRAFRPWMTFNVCWTFSMTLGGSLSTVFFLDELHIKDNLFGGVMALTALSLFGSLFSSRLSGEMVDQVGVRKMLFWGHVFWATLPAFWIAATPETALFWLAIPSVVGGVSSAAAVNATNKFITRVPPPEHRTMYVAVSSSLGNVAAGIGVLTAGLVLRALGDWRVEVGSRLFGAFHVLFVASFCLRMASTLLLVRRIRQCNGAGPVAADATGG
jgi:MFS family permease